MKEKVEYMCQATSIIGLFAAFSNIEQLGPICDHVTPSSEAWRFEVFQ